MRVELVAAGPPPFQLRAQQVDEPLGVAELGAVIRSKSRWRWTSPLGVRVGRDRRCPRSRRVLVGVGRDLDAQRARARSSTAPRPSPSGLVARRALLACSRSTSGVVPLEPRRRQLRARGGARTARTRGRRPRGRRGGGRTGPHRCRARRPCARCRRRRARARGRSRSPPRGRSTAGRAERPPEADRLGEQAPAVDQLAGRRAEDRRAGGVAWVMTGQARRYAWAVASARYVAPSAPRTWRMSSSYLRTTPSVSSTTSGLSSAAPSDSSADAQSSVSATPGTLVRSAVAQPVDERDDLAGEARRRVGHAGRDDLVLLDAVG